MEYIAPRFNKIKNAFCDRIHNIGLHFDDDVFSQTIIQCNDKLSENNDNTKITDDMLWYFWKAFKNNTLREFKYARNKITDEDIPEDIIEEEYDNSIDITFNEISNMIINKFGEELYQLFVLHANGTHYDELEKITNIQQIKYKFRKIREYIRKKCKRED